MEVIPKNLLMGSSVRLSFSLAAIVAMPLRLPGDGLPMRHLFYVSCLTFRRQILLGMVATGLVFGTLTLLKIKSVGTQAPTEELVTGSIQRSLIFEKPASNEPTVSFQAPTTHQPDPPAFRRAALVRELVPLPRPRPKGL